MAWIVGLVGCGALCKGVRRPKDEASEGATTAKPIATSLPDAKADDPLEEPGIDCQNHDPDPDVSKNRFLACGHADHQGIRSAIERYCEPLLAHAEDGEGRTCAQMRRFVASCICPIELHMRGDRGRVDGGPVPARSFAWLGGTTDALFFGAHLEKEGRSWRATGVFFDDYERP